MNTEKLTAFCLSLPGVAETVKWEDHLCFTVGEKIFCMTGFTDESGVTMKVPTEEFDELTEREGIIQAPYMARNQWVSVQKRSALKPDQWEHYLRQSYELVKAKLTKKQRMEIDHLTGKTAE